ncbi:allantoinase AllB [Opitutia bacterium ISCC 51]|nr:allantoinase AllB [Opitutae bacterium ISCC 51]QXD29877.1 allantoinase AllB [Opitutae bacterium ISCC 52]
MAEFDTVILSGKLVTPDGEIEKDLGILDGKIATIESGLSGQGATEIDASADIVIPGIIDSHVHINEPGNTDWEGFDTGSKAALAGGVTCLFDMPLNSIPTTVDLDGLQKKLERAQANCRCDFALYGGLIPGNQDQLEALYKAGVIAFKGFMSNSGLEEFPCVDAEELKKGMETIAKLPGMRLALHAEDNELTGRLGQQCVDSGQTSYQDFLDSRPIEAELLAIQCAIEISKETNCPIHIVHVSCAEGIDLITEAKEQDVDITVETCPHYFALNSSILETVGPLAKCAPPLRNASAVEALRFKLRKGEFDTIGSDHSPCPESMKNGNTFFDAWGGISSLQHAAVISYSILKDDLNLSLSDISKLLSSNPAARFNLPNKGSIALGKDADLAIIDFNDSQAIRREQLHYKNPHSPYLGMTFPMQVKQTMVRGRSVYDQGTFSEELRGQFTRSEK